MSQETIEKVFGRDRFSIPKYQRDYAWGVKNFKELWEDLSEALDFNQGHFLGTMVVAKNQEDSGKYDIIDGQQRTTTIFMLLYVLISKSEYKDNLKTKYLLDRKNSIKLEVAPQNQEFFKELLDEIDSGKNELSVALKNKANTDGKQKMYEVANAILDEVSRKNNLEQIQKYIDKLLEMIMMWLEEPNAGRGLLGHFKV